MATTLNLPSMLEWRRKWQMSPTSLQHRTPSSHRPIAIQWMSLSQVFFLRISLTWKKKKRKVIEQFVSKKNAILILRLSRIHVFILSAACAEQSKRNGEEGKKKTVRKWISLEIDLFVRNQGKHNNSRRALGTTVKCYRTQKEMLRKFVRISLTRLCFYLRHRQQRSRHGQVCQNIDEGGGFERAVVESLTNTSTHTHTPIHTHTNTNIQYCSAKYI